jgi:hypothetical protein
MPVAKISNSWLMVTSFDSCSIGGPQAVLYHKPCKIESSFPGLNPAFAGFDTAHASRKTAFSEIFLLTVQAEYGYVIKFPAALSFGRLDGLTQNRNRILGPAARSGGTGSGPYSGPVELIDTAVNLL